MLNPLRRGALIVALGLLLRPDAALAQAQPAAAAPASRTRAHVDTLASPKLEGRLTGSPGADAAAAYIEAELKRIGARPLPGGFGFRVPFTFTSGVKDEGTSVSLMPVDAADKRESWSDRSTVAALSFSESGEVTAPVVFAGYGLRVPAENGSGFVYDSYAGLDVKDKIVLVLRYVPEKVEREQREQMVRYSALRYKALAARQAGAKAMLIVSGPNSPGRGQVIPLTFDTAASGSGIVAVSVSERVASALVRTGRQDAARGAGRPRHRQPARGRLSAGHAPCARQREADVARPPRPTTSPDTFRPRATSPASPSRG